ncbi:MAG: PEGA domain-containing protein [Deltaproteobacteria bacterium]|nr:MAG: PEGA domain-containing protein [Deltaproteobacteria bacterium]
MIGRALGAICLSLALLSPGGAAADVAPPGPSPRTTVVVFVVADDLPGPSRATTQLAVERALERNPRLVVEDKDIRLAQRSGAYDADAAQEARGLLATGEALLAKGRAADALVRLDAAAHGLEAALPFVPKRELARAQYLVGAAHAALGHADEARRTFVRLLTWRPRFALDPRVAPGHTVVLFDAARRAVASLPRGRVRVRANIAYAQAYVDGVFVGFTPTSKAGLPAGDHYVTVRAEGYVRQVAKVTVRPDRSAFARVELTRSPGRDAVDRAVAAIAPRLGAAALAEPLARLRERLDVDHAVFVAVDGASYTAFVYDLASGSRLARAEARIGDDEDPQRAFLALADALYTEAFRVAAAPAAVPAAPAAGRRRPFYRRWWFWTGVGVAAAVAAAPFLLPERRAAPSCPRDHVCGEVVFRVGF